MQKNFFFAVSSSLLTLSIVKAIIHSPGHTLAIIAVLGVTLAGPTFSNYRYLVKTTGMDLGMILAVANQSTLLELYLQYTPDYDFKKTNYWGENIRMLASKTPQNSCLPVIATHDSRNFSALSSLN